MGSSFDRATMALDGIIRCRPEGASTPSVLGIVGTAPIHHAAEADRAIQAIRIVNSDDLGRRLFGPDLDGYSIPMAVTINAMEDGPLLLAINVFDPAIHNSPVPATPAVFDAMGICQLETRDWISAALTSGDGTILYREGVDYTFDKVAGRLRRLPKAGFLPSDTLLVSGIRGDPGKVSPADIVGAVDAVGARTGLQLWRTAFQALGFFPTDLVCPGFESLPSVWKAMEAMAHLISAIAHVQMTAGLTVEDALAARGPSGVANFQVSSDRVKLFYPLYKSPKADPSAPDARSAPGYPSDARGATGHMSDARGASGSARLVPLSLGYACVWGRTILDRGFWQTGSNKPLRSAIGLERPITFGGENDDANLLNAAGIATLKSGWGGSLTPWGPSTSAFPEAADPTHFDCVRRFYDVVDRRIALTLLNYIDEPLTPSLIERIVKEINDFYDLLVARGGLVRGACKYLPKDNPPAQLALGWIVTQDEVTPPPPFQRLTRHYRFNRNHLAEAFAS